MAMSKETAKIEARMLFVLNAILSSRIPVMMRMEEVLQMNVRTMSRASMGGRAMFLENELRCDIRERGGLWCSGASSIGIF